MFGSAFRSLKKVVIHELSHGWDRRGRIATLEFEAYQNQEYQKPLVVNSVRSLTSYLAPHYSATPYDEYDFQEMNECWILYDHRHHDGVVRVTVRHKYWAEKQIDCFNHMIIALARLYKARLEDEREVPSPWD